MIVSHQKKFVILAPWKTASSSTWLRLSHYSETPYSRFYDFNPYLNRVVHQHLTYADFTALPESRLGYFTAAFIRNPYDQVYSGFRQLIKDVRQQPHQEFPNEAVRSLVMEQLAENFAKLCAAGFDFGNWVKSLQEHQVLDSGRNSSFPLHPSHYWTHSNGRLAVDYVGRVESFEQDFKALCERLELDVVSNENANVDVDPAIANLDKRGYKFANQMSRSSIDRINQLFRQDFEYFDYERL